MIEFFEYVRMANAGLSLIAMVAVVRMAREHWGEYAFRARWITYSYATMMAAAMLGSFYQAAKGADGTPSSLLVTVSCFMAYVAWTVGDKQGLFKHDDEDPDGRH